MLFSKSLLLFIATMTSTITGAALPDPAATVDTPTSTALEKREVNGANCWKYRDEYNSWYLIKTWGTWDQDWGKGLLDNIRGQCNRNIYGDVQQWGFHFEAGPPPTPGYASFLFWNTDIYYNHCILDAVWLASNAAGQSIEGATCWESNKWW